MQNNPQMLNYILQNPSGYYRNYGDKSNFNMAGKKCNICEAQFNLRESVIYRHCQPNANFDGKLVKISDSPLKLANNHGYILVSCDRCFGSKVCHDNMLVENPNCPCGGIMFSGNW